MINGITLMVGRIREALGRKVEKHGASGLTSGAESPAQYIGRRVAGSPGRRVAGSPHLRPRGSHERVRMAAPAGPSVFPA